MDIFNLETIGELKTHHENPEDWLISEPISIAFWDGAQLKFSFDKESFYEKDFLFNANQAIQNFLRKKSGDKLKDSNLVYKNYRLVQAIYESDDTLKLNNESEIWNFVYPSEIYVCQDSKEDENIYLLVYCECEWEQEHGLQLVFKNGFELTRVSAIDCSPTE